LNHSNVSEESTKAGATRAADETKVDVNLVATMVREIVADMNLGACAETITQTVQILDLANGKKAALCITVTTDHELYM
jgi:hypothetical protein